MRGALAGVLFCVIVAEPLVAQSARKTQSLSQKWPPDTNPQYFPAGGEGNDGNLSDFAARWYASQLRAMKEPSLYERKSSAGAESADAGGEEIYRITILPTWGNAIAYRVRREKDIYILSSRRLSGQAGYETGKLVESKDVTLSSDDSKELSTLIQKVNFFQMPTREKVRGLDGDEWMMEGTLKGKYHVAVRWCAEDYEPQKRNLTDLLALAKFLTQKSTLSQKPSSKGH